MVFIFITIVVISLFGIETAQKNLSPLGNATQSSTFSSYIASLAITGVETNDWNSGSCSHTGYVTGGAWWMLSLPNNTMFIERVNMFFRSGYEARFDGYSLYLSNTSISGNQIQIPPGILCYKDLVDGIVSITQRRECYQMAQYTIIYTEHVADQGAPFLILCDVQVIGCSKHRFGRGCSAMCSPKCFDQHCYPNNGSCVWGCNCLSNDCDGNEICTTGCKKGFMGHYCNQQCPKFYFGENCKYTCHCNNPAGCDDIDGICLEGGCQAGWQGRNCSTGCAPFSFGEDCRYTCHCSNAAGCDNVDGICLEGGCQAGWLGKNCSTECYLGHYGLNCKNTCDGCFGKLCNNKDGECIDKTRCNPGWKSDLPFCNIPCSSNTFGEHCTHQCHCRNQIISCNSVDATCPVGGCEKGWQGNNCNTECLNGRYGFDCLQTCSHCYNNTCNKVTGACSFSCPQEIIDACSTEIAQQNENKYDSSSIAITSGIAALVIVIQAAIIIFLSRRQNCLNCVMCKLGSEKSPTDGIIASKNENAYELTSESNYQNHSYSTLRTDTKKCAVDRAKSNDGIYEIPGNGATNM